MLHLDSSKLCYLQEKGVTGKVNSSMKYVLHINVLQVDENKIASLIGFLKSFAVQVYTIVLELCTSLWNNVFNEI